MHVDQRVLVVGGGLSGLSTAMALRQRGFDAAVFEAAPELREAGAGVNVWVNGMMALARLGLAERVLCAGAPVDIHRTRTRRGRVLSTVPVGALARDHGLLPPVVVRRTELLRALAEPIPAAVVHHGAQAVGFVQDPDGVTLHLADGTQERGALLVGADGINSAIRAQLVPEVRPRYAGYQSLRGLVRFQHPLIAPAVFTMTHGRGDRFGYCPAGHGWLWWFGVMPLPEGSTDPPAGRQAELLDHFGDFAEPVPTILAATPDDAILRNDVRDVPPLSRWGEGRVTLVGDAAHAAAVGGGRGVSEAIEDSVVLADCLAAAATAAAAGAEGHDLISALRRFEAARRPPTAANQNRSWDYGVLLSRTSPLACTARDLTVALRRRRAVEATAAEFSRLAAATAFR
jgi:2-polyprenyl-6-methoxyphenol hydroxylase-like FAD-dependent oxidoreductase